MLPTGHTSRKLAFQFFPFVSAGTRGCHQQATCCPVLLRQLHLCTLLLPLPTLYRWSLLCLQPKMNFHAGTIDMMCVFQGIPFQHWPSLSLSDSSPRIIWYLLPRGPWTSFASHTYNLTTWIGSRLWGDAHIFFKSFIQFNSTTQYGRWQNSLN